MAILTFGQAARSTNAISFTNVGTLNYAPGFLHGGLIGPNAKKSFSFNTLDALLSATNLTQNNIYDVNPNGSSYQNDIGELAQLIASGKIIAHSAVLNSSTHTFTTAVSGLVFATYGDGSVVFA